MPTAEEEIVVEVMEGVFRPLPRPRSPAASPSSAWAARLPTCPTCRAA